MSTGTMYQIDSSSSDATFAFGERLGKLCRGGEVLVLASDLGGGKTTLTKGIVKGLGSSDQVTSPTFTVSQIYKGRDNFEIHHFDFYRLNESGVVGMELSEVIDEPNVITVIEWGNIVENVLPPRSIVISLERLADRENGRRIIVSLPTEAAYLAEAMK